jgi:hypothetical protein
MPELLVLDTFTDRRGNLSVLEDRQIPFKIKRLFYIYGVDKSLRAGHRHKTTYQALISINGSCRVHVDNGRRKSNYLLDEPRKCLVLNPEDWHTIEDFIPRTVLLVCASEYYDEKDYIFEGYE